MSNMYSTIDSEQQSDAALEEIYGGQVVDEQQSTTSTTAQETDNGLHQVGDANVSEEIGYWLDGYEKNNDGDRNLNQVNSEDLPLISTGGRAYGDKNTGIFEPQSMFQKYSLLNYRGMVGGVPNINLDSPNTTLGKFYDVVGGCASSLFHKNAHNPTYQNIIDAYSNTNAPYSISDFLYSKWFNEIPNNYMVTVRRFPQPCYDNVITIDSGLQAMGGWYMNNEGYSNENSAGGSQIDLNNVSSDRKSKNGKSVLYTAADDMYPCIGTAVTYFGEECGNPLKDILKFEYGLKWKQITSDLQSLENTDGDYTTQPWLQGMVARTVATAARGYSDPAHALLQKAHTPGGDIFGQKYGEFVIGPVNVVNETQARDRGMQFSNAFTLNFNYIMRSLNFVNPRVAMIDLIVNMLSLTYNNAQFWGGGQRWYNNGGYLGPQFGDPNLLRQGKWREYAKDFSTDARKGIMNVLGLKSDHNGKVTGTDGKSALMASINGIIDMIGRIANASLANFLDTNIGHVGQTQIAKAEISGDPCGYWHVTLGNPLNPIAMMGNMIAKSSSLSFGNELGFDDFPVELNVAMTLEHGRPRDRGDIENMFNLGHGRIYIPLGTDSRHNQKAVDAVNGNGVNVGATGPNHVGVNMGMNYGVQKSQADRAQKSSKGKTTARGGRTNVDGRQESWGGDTPQNGFLEQIPSKTFQKSNDSILNNISALTNDIGLNVNDPAVKNQQQNNQKK